MGLWRDNMRGHPAAPRTHNIRMGGRVSLFNYNPSIAGGAISVKRYTNAHRLGKVLRKDAQRTMTNIIGAEGAGIKNPGHHVGAMMGVAPASSNHHSNEHRKRVREAMEKQFGGGGGHAKKRRGGGGGGLYA